MSTNRFVESAIQPGYVIDLDALPGEEAAGLWAQPNDRVTVHAWDILRLIELTSPECMAVALSEDDYDAVMQIRSDLRAHLMSHQSRWRDLAEQ